MTFYIALTVMGQDRSFEFEVEETDVEHAGSAVRRILVQDFPAISVSSDGKMLCVNPRLITSFTVSETKPKSLEYHKP